MLCILVVGGCVSDAEEDQHQADIGIGAPSTPPTNNECSEFSETRYQRGENEYEQQCSSCHVSDDLNEQYPSDTGGTRFIDYVAQAMPLLSPASCDEGCAEDIWYFLANEANDSTARQCPDPVIAPDPDTPPDNRELELVSKPLTGVLYKSLMSLVGRIPTESEIQQVNQNGQAGLISVLDQAMTETAFLSVRLKEIFNDTLKLHDYVLDKQTDYDYRWCDQFDGDQGEYACQLIKESVRDEPFLLMRYLVENNRPFTEVLSSDFTVVNPYSAYFYNVDSQLSFRKWNGSKYPNEPQLTDDPYDIKMVRLNFPHAGILSTLKFLDDSGTTDVNRNRHRAYLLFDQFLDLDLFRVKGGNRPMAETPAITEVLTNTSCTSCHNIMDPVASGFQNFGSGYSSRVPTPWFSERNPNEMLPAGFSAEVYSASNSNEDPLQWVAKEIVKTDGFSLSIVKILAEGLTGQKMLRLHEVDLEEDVALANVQSDFFLSSCKAVFEQSNYNLKEAIKCIVLDEFYYADNLTGNSIVEEKVGAVRLLSPEMLTRKYQAIMGDDHYDYVMENKIFYGGVDFPEVTDRLSQPNGFVVAIKNLGAFDVACRVAELEFSRSVNDRLYLGELSLNDTPPQNELAIRQTIKKMMWAMWGEAVAVDHMEVSSAYELIKSVWETVVQDDDAPNRFVCDTEGEEFEVNDAEQADVAFSWVVLITYLLSDYQFTYE